MLTIKPNNLEKSYSRISEKHDQTYINLAMCLTLQANFQIMLCLTKSNGFVPSLNTLHKNL